MKTSFYHVIVFAIVCSLPMAACGGGGGGVGPNATASSVPASSPAPAPAPQQTTPTPTVTVPANFQPANTTITYPITSAVAGPSSTGLTPASPSEGLTAAIVTTDASGSFGRISFSLPNVAGKTVTADVNLTFVSPQLSQLASMLKQVFGPFIDDDAIVLALVQSAGSQALTSSAFGLWGGAYENDPSGNGAGRAYAFAFGNLTPSASVPATGSANFNGTTTGMGGGGGTNSLYALQGNAQMIANFSTQSVTSKFTNLTTQNIYTNATGALPDLTGTAAISGNAYSGPITGTGLTGSLNGHFYGSAAQETAGVWLAAGAGNSWMGSFGAK